MWTKFSNVLKSRQDDNDTGSFFQGQHHPNMSTRSLVSNLEGSIQNQSPPGSPSKQGRRSMFKRTPKVPKSDDSGRSSPFGLPMGLPKRVKSHLNLNGNGSQASLAQWTDPRPSHDTLRSYQEPMPRASQDSIRSPIDPNQSSVRSILRVPKTPGTGQNVRFFSRDAYKVVSPDQSLETEGTPEPTSIVDRLRKMPGLALEQPEHHPMPSTEKGVGNRPSVTEIFTPASPLTANDVSPSLMIPMPPPNVSNIFDMSQDRHLQPIPSGNDALILDNPVEIADGNDQAFSSTPYKDSDDKTTYHSMGLSDVTEDDGENSQLPTEPMATRPQSARDHGRSHSFSFGQTVFHSLARTSGSSSEWSRLSDSSSISRNRFHSTNLQEADFNDGPDTEPVLLTGPTTDAPDPFRANATTYYTPQTLIPPTPPPNSAHSRTASKEDDVIWSLRTQLALQQELCAQYEIDLGARDEMVQALTARCEKTEKEGERRRGVLRTWKKKVGELEKACRGLQEEVERGREESWERSVMDEASGEALKCLQSRIEILEREKSEGEKKAQKVLEEKEGLEVVLAKVNVGPTDSKEPTGEDIGGNSVEETEVLLAKSQHARASVAERERHRVAESEWQEERARLMSRAAQVEADSQELDAQLAAAQEQLTQKDHEYGVLKNELEAQWKHTESASEQMEKMRKEMDAVREEAEGLERRIGEMAMEWNASESRRAKLEGDIQENLNKNEALEREKYELEEQLRGEHEQNGQLLSGSREQERRIASLDSEYRFAMDNVSRLEENIRQRDSEIANYSQGIAERQTAVEQLREQMMNLRQEHARIVDDQVQEMQGVTDSEKIARGEIETMKKTKAEADLALDTLKEQASALKDEVERLRRQVHELQQESADKEVKVVQLTKQRSQDKEDMQGLNIALDSKQQELELLKRKLGVKGTAGSTPAQPSKIRRDSSSAFPTPGISRPPSALSDTSRDNIRGIETPTATKPLSKNIRTTTAAKSATGSMGPPPLKHSRASLGTPTPANTRLSSSLARSASVNSTSSAPGISRRASSTALEQARMKMSASGRKINQNPAPNELDEKENVESQAPAKVKRRASVMLMPTAA